VRSLALAALLLAAACGRDVTSIGALRGHSASDASLPRDAAPARDAAPTASSYIEAEDGELSAGFTVVDAADASGGHAIAPPADSTDDDAPGAARARYAFEIDSAGEYVIWGRIHSPGASNNRFWFRVDGGAWYKWRLSAGDIWFWDDLHDDTSYGTPLRFALEAGAHELLIASCVPDVLLDRLYLTAAGDVPPGNDTPCHPPHSIEIDGGCQPSCGALTGTACGEQACAGHDLLQAYDCDVCCHADP
jgi:hypothetical protein